MSKRKVEFVVICEDRQQQVFVRHFLRACGFHARKIRFDPAPRGQGSGEQYVRKRYGPEVAVYRKRNPAHHRLIAAIDADTQTVAHRQQQLSDELAECDEAPRRSGERIIHVIPKRNIETWIHYLLDNNDVDEATSYKQQYRGLHERDHCQPTAKKLHELFQLSKADRPLPSDLLPSLETAIKDEFTRLA